MRLEMAELCEEKARLRDLLNISDSDISASDNSPVLNSYFVTHFLNRMKQPEGHRNEDGLQMQDFFLSI
jgi:hypothetical protein